jgi:hypothetical protein
MRLSESADSRYEQFLQTVQPIGLGLAKASLQLDRRAYVKAKEQKNGATRVISTEYKLLNAEEGHFDATGSFSLTVTGGKSSGPALTIECIYEAHFHCKAPVDRDLAERFTTSELRLVLWPYFREMVTNYCGKMCISPITIPLSTS